MKVKDKLNLPENFAIFETRFSNHKLDKDYTGELNFIQKQRDLLIPFIRVLRENLKGSKEDLFSYIEMASENKVKFSFPRDNKTVREKRLEAQNWFTTMAEKYREF